MDQDHSQERTGPDEEEGRVDAEERCVGELEDCAGDGHGEGHLWVGNAELVEMVNVSETEDNRGEKNCASEGNAGYQEERHRCGTEEAFLSNGTLGMLSVCEGDWCEVVFHLRPRSSASLSNVNKDPSKAAIAPSLATRHQSEGPRTRALRTTRP